MNQNSLTQESDSHEDKLDKRTMDLQDKIRTRSAAGQFAVINKRNSTNAKFSSEYDDKNTSSSPDLSNSKI